MLCFQDLPVPNLPASPVVFDREWAVAAGVVQQQVIAHLPIFPQTCIHLAAAEGLDLV